MFTNTATTAMSHNGPICATCDRPYIGTHHCAPADLYAKAARLIDMARGMSMTQSHPVDRTAGCPCRPENGGSGVCGCIMGGPQITCTTTAS